MAHHGMSEGRALNLGAVPTHSQSFFPLLAVLGACNSRPS